MRAVDGKIGAPRLSRVRDSYLNLPSRWAPYWNRLATFCTATWAAKVCTQFTDSSTRS